LLSQGVLDANSNVLPLHIVLPEIYLTINSQKLENKGHIFGGSLDITTSRNGHDVNQKEADCSSGLGQIKALHDLKLKGFVFENKTFLDAETMTLTYQKIINEEKGAVAARYITIIADHLDNKNLIVAENLLDIKARDEAHNHEKACLKSEGNIFINANLLNNGVRGAMEQGTDLRNFIFTLNMRIFI
jgi:hypothetical protein